MACSSLEGKCFFEWPDSPVTLKYPPATSVLNENPEFPARHNKNKGLPCRLLLLCMVTVVFIAARSHLVLLCAAVVYFLYCSLLCVVFRDLFNVAFVSCWSELHEELQNELVKHLELALESQIPEITQTLLNLAEFMEHTEKVKRQ